MVQQANTFCVTFPQLQAVGVSKSQYDKWCQRGTIKRVKRACHGKPAEVDYSSLPQDVQLKLSVSLNLAENNLHEKEQQDKFKASIGIDHRALQFYHKYKVEATGKRLPDATIRQYATNANILNAIHENFIDARIMRTKLGDSMTKFWPLHSNVVNGLKKELGHSLPGNSRELKAKYEAYIKPLLDGGEPEYAALISKKFGNTNTVKLFSDAKDWLVAMYSLPTKIQVPQLFDEYNEKAELEGWNVLEDESTIYKYLMQPDVKKLWYGPRHGELEAYKALSIQLKTKMPTVPNRIWTSDGTKLNFYFKRPGATAKNDYTAQATVYVVIDVFSEKILGWSVTPKANEDHETQLLAIRQAMHTSGVKPQEWRYDGQGGHMKIENNGIFKVITGLAHRTKPHNPRGKTIENLFGRIQMYMQKQQWYYTGQNITSKRLDSKANMEFILSHLADLPTFEEAVQAWADCVDKWNSLPHHKHGSTKNELYHNTPNPDAAKFEVWDAINAFYVKHETPGNRGRGLQYKNNGISFKFKGKEYCYEVYAGNEVDQAFRDSYLGTYFTVKYDVYDMGQVALYTDGPMGELFVAIAEQHKEVGYSRLDITPDENKFAHSVWAGNKAAAERNLEHIQAMWEKTGVSPEGLVKKPAPTTIGGVMKEETYLDPLDGDKELVAIEDKPKEKKGIYRKF